jgi:hypothetical protein
MRDPGDGRGIASRRPQLTADVINFHDAVMPAHGALLELGDPLRG